MSDANAAAADTPAGEPPPLLTLRPRRGWLALHLDEIWRSRELIGLLAFRDLRIRYRQTLLGVAWVVFQPLANVLVFSLFFTLLRVNPASPGVPYALSAFMGLILWQLFATTLGLCSDSLVGNQSLIKKVYCCRLAFPLAPAVVALVDFACNAVALAVLMAVYGFAPPGASSPPRRSSCSPASSPWGSGSGFPPSASFTATSGIRSPSSCSCGST